MIWDSKKQIQFQWSALTFKSRLFSPTIMKLWNIFVFILWLRWKQYGFYLKFIKCQKTDKESLLNIWDVIKIIKLVGRVLTELLTSWDWNTEFKYLNLSPHTPWNSTTESDKHMYKCRLYLSIAVWLWIYNLFFESSYLCSSHHCVLLLTDVDAEVQRD